MTAEKDHDKIAHDFGDAVNRTPAELEKWLKTQESKDVGWTYAGEHESVGHESGRHIIAIKHKKKPTSRMPITRICARSSATCTATWRNGRKAMSARRAGATR